MNTENYIKKELPITTRDALLQTLLEFEKKELEKIARRRHQFFICYEMTGAPDCYFSNNPPYRQIETDAGADYDRELKEINDLEQRTLAYFAGVRRSILNIKNSTT